MLPPMSSSKKPPMPKKVFTRHKPRSRAREEGVLKPQRQVSRGNSRNKNRNRIRSGQPTSNHAIHYNDYVKKYNNIPASRGYSGKKEVEESKNKAKENRGKVYRSRVSSADVNKDRKDAYNQMYGFKPIWWG